MTEQQTGQQERELDYWMARAYEAEGKLWKAEARIRHLEDTAQVLVKEVLDAENARDENRRGKAKAEARIKAVEDVLDNLEQQSPDQIGWDAAGLLPVLRRALESVPPPRA